MDKTTTDIIEVCLEKLTVEALTAFKTKVRKIYSFAEHPAFATDSMISEAVRVAEETVSQLLGKAVSAVSAITEEPEAFRPVHDAVAAHLLDLERAIEQGRGITLPPATLKVVSERFKAVSQRSYHNLENYRSSFKGKKNTGGRPDKYAWGEVEAHVRTEFPNGLPKGQGAKAKIVKVMAVWFAANADDEPDNSVLYDRANRLIKKYP